MRIPFRLITDEAPPRLPNLGNIGPRPAAPVNGARRVAPASVTHLAGAGHFDPAGSKASNASTVSMASAVSIAVNDGLTWRDEAEPASGLMHWQTGKPANRPRG
jgi:hypothetical protein